MNIIPIFNDNDPAEEKPRLHNIPQMLRDLAEQIETGAEEAQRVVLVIVDSQEEWSLRMYGAAPGKIAVSAFHDLHKAAYALIKS